MNAATFVLSTGRCGTQWLAKNLIDHYADRLAVCRHLDRPRSESLRQEVGATRVLDCGALEAKTHAIRA